MIMTKKAPTLAIARIAYGESIVNSLIQSHLVHLAIAEGVTTTPDACAAIAEDIMSGYADLKITELILAFKMIREGKFRECGGDRNRGQFYGSLSSGTICDCLYQFRFNYRNKVLDAHADEIMAEQAEADRRREEESYQRDIDSVYRILFRLHWYDINKFYNEVIYYIKPQDMPTLEFYARELRALDRLRELCEGLIMSVDKYNEEHPNEPLPDMPEMSGIRKGVKYINNHR